jgi:predicted site-specific integrase-resolvase
MKLNINQAAKSINVARSTLYRDINNGKVSINKDAKGRSFIDVSELERVYGEVTLSDMSENVLAQQSDTVEKDTLLQREIELLREHIDILKDERDDLRQRLNSEAEERKKLTLILTHQKETEDRKKTKTSDLYEKIFGKKNRTI